MLSKTEIVIKLRKLGFKEENIDDVISDVVQIILDKTLSKYFSHLPNSEQLTLKQFSAEQLLKYIESNKNNLPKFSSQEFSKIYDETWENYFNVISK